MCCRNQNIDSQHVICSLAGKFTTLLLLCCTLLLQSGTAYSLFQSTRNGPFRYRSRTSGLRNRNRYRIWVKSSDDFDISVKNDESSTPGLRNDKAMMADYMATCVPGMAYILADEIATLGGQQIQSSGNSAVYFRAPLSNPRTILTILLWCRTAHKIMELLCRSNEPVYTRNDIYQWVRGTIDTTDLLLASQKDHRTKKKWLSLSVSVTFNNAIYIPSDINHSHYTALNVKNALVDAAREISERDLEDFESDRPNVDVTDTCDVPLVVVVRGIQSSISYNSHVSSDFGKNGRNDDNQSTNTKSSGGANVSIFRCIHGVGSLHRRGYRSNMHVHKAAMKESTAAALLYAAQWHTKCHHQQNKHSSEIKGGNCGAVLLDPMMGSGTFLIEGAMMAADIAPGLMRIKCGVPSSESPPILKWKICDIDGNDTDHAAEQCEPTHLIYRQLLIDATKRAQLGIKSLSKRSIQIIGNDIHSGAYDLADSAFRKAGIRDHVQLHCSDCSQWKPSVSLSNSSNETLWTIVSNPPWGVRLNDDMELSWEALRTFLRGENSIVPKNESEVWILSGNAEATKHLGLRRSQSIPLQTGEQNLRWLQYILRPPETSTQNKRDRTVALKPVDAASRYTSELSNKNGCRVHRDAGVSMGRVDYQQPERYFDRNTYSNPNKPSNPLKNKTSQGRGQQNNQNKQRKSKHPESPNRVNEWLI